MSTSGEEPPEEEELPILPYPDRRAGRSSGWSGSDTSRERAERDDSGGTTSRRQIQTLSFLRENGDRGVTWKELADRYVWHHGQASGVLSNLHKVGRVERLAEKRNRCHPYVLSDRVNGRDVQPFGGKKRPSLAEAWEQGHAAESDAENPYRE